MLSVPRNWSPRIRTTLPSVVGLSRVPLSMSPSMMVGCCSRVGSPGWAAGGAPSKGGMMSPAGHSAQFSGLSSAASATPGRQAAMLRDSGSRRRGSRTGKGYPAKKSPVACRNRVHAGNEGAVAAQARFIRGPGPGIAIQARSAPTWATAHSARASRL